MRKILNSLFISLFTLSLFTFPVEAIELVNWSEDDEIAINEELSLLYKVIDEEYLDNKVLYHLHVNRPQYSCWSTLICFGKLEYSQNPKMRGLIVHEIAHHLFTEKKLEWDDIEYSIGYYENNEYIHISGINPITGKFERTDLGYIEPNQPYCQHCTYMEPDGQSYKEDYADMFMAFVMGYFSNDIAGKLRKETIRNIIKNNFSFHDPIIQEWQKLNIAFYPK